MSQRWSAIFCATGVCWVNRWGVWDNTIYLWYQKSSQRSFWILGQWTFLFKKEWKICIFKIIICLNLSYPQKRVKNWKSAFENKILKPGILFQKFWFQNRKNRYAIVDNIEKICLRFSGTVSNEIDPRANGLHRDHLTAWKLIFFSNINSAWGIYLDLSYSNDTYSPDSLHVRSL